MTARPESTTGGARRAAGVRNDSVATMTALRTPMRTLEAAVGQAGRPGHDQAWREAVIAALGHLMGALTEQQATYQRRKGA